MNEKSKNDQLERFFKHNPIEDSLYLKKYVKDHPDHKMAWYLLGKDYMGKGKDSKVSGETALTPTSTENKPVQMAEASPNTAQQGTQIFYITGNRNEELEKMILPTDASWNQSLLVEGIKTPDGLWVNWYKPPH